MRTPVRILAYLTFVFCVSVFFGPLHAHAITSLEESLITTSPWILRVALGCIVFLLIIWWFFDRRGRIREASIKTKGEAYLSGVLNATNSGILAVSTSGHVIYLNDLFPKMWRIPKEILDTKDDKKLIAFVSNQLKNPEDFIAKVQELYASDETVTEFIEFKDGRIFERISAPLRNGERIGRVWSFRDVTAEERAKEALIENKHVLEESEKIGGFGSYVLDIPEKRWASSESLVSIFGIDDSFEKTIDRWVSLIHPDDRQPMSDYLMINVFQNHERFDREYRIIRNDDKIERWVHQMGRLEFNKDGNPIKIIGTVQDISKQKELNDAKTEFISIASHQLRTPLSGINWIIEAIKKDSEGSSLKQKQHINDLSIMANRLRHLTEDLLRFSQIETESAVAGLNEEVDCFVLLKQYVRDMSGYATQKNHKLIIQNDIVGPLKIKTNTGAVSNVFENFLSNALEYSNEGEPITIHMEKVEHSVKISVINKGIPISQEDQQHLFERFYRGELAKKVKPDGSGMGLYVAKKIIRNLGGKIGYDFREGNTTFWFSIPLRV